MADVVFSAFDERAGPIAVFATIKDPVVSKKIAVKSIVSTLTSIRSNTSENMEGEAIIPFPDENLISFIYYTTLNQRTETGELRVVTMSAIVPKTQNSLLYSNAALLSQSAIAIKALLNQNYEFGKPLPKSLTVELEGWGKLKEAPKSDIIAEKELEFSLSSLFNLFPAKKGRRSFSDPLLQLFFGIMAKIPVILVGPNVEFLLEISDLLRDFLTDEELDVRISIDLQNQDDTAVFNIPRADIILLDERQNQRRHLYYDPIALVGVGRESRYANYAGSESVEKTFNTFLKKAREISDDGVAFLYLKGELLSFTAKLTNLKAYCLSGRQGKAKEIAKIINVDEEYLFALAEVLRLRNMVPITELNKMFKNTTEYEEMEIRSKEVIGFVR